MGRKKDLTEKKVVDGMHLLHGVEVRHPSDVLERVGFLCVAFVR